MSAQDQARSDPSRRLFLRHAVLAGASLTVAPFPNAQAADGDVEGVADRHPKGGATGCLPRPLEGGRDVENWCLDWYGPYPVHPQTSPIGYARGEVRVVCGGSWHAPADGPALLTRLGAGRCPNESGLDTIRGYDPALFRRADFLCQCAPSRANGPLFSKHNRDPVLTYDGGIQYHFNVAWLQRGMASERDGLISRTHDPCA